MDKLKIQECARLILSSDVLQIRDVDAGEELFFYTSGHQGPGYVSIKDLVGKTVVMKHLMKRLAEKFINVNRHVNFVAGNATGGIVPGWLMRDLLEKMTGRIVPFVYVKDKKDSKADKEIIGISNEINLGDCAVVVDELVNFASTTCDSALALRKAGYKVNEAACILYYGHIVAEALLKQSGLKMTCLLTLNELLDYAEQLGFYPVQLINSYREFLRDPIEWQRKRGLLPRAIGDFVAK